MQDLEISATGCWVSSHNEVLDYHEAAEIKQSLLQMMQVEISLSRGVSFQITCNCIHGSKMFSLRKENSSFLSPYRNA